MAFCDVCGADANKPVEIGTDSYDFVLCWTCAETVHAAVDEGKTCLTCMYWTRWVCQKEFKPNDVELPEGWACNQWDWAEVRDGMTVCGRDWAYTLMSEKDNGWWRATILAMAHGPILANDQDTLVERVRLHIEQHLLKVFDENGRGTA